MILGMGSDIVDIRRIEKAMNERFVERIFTESEQEKALSRKKAGKKAIAATYAKRFAAKEACAKALGTGIGEGVSWLDMEVVNQPGGQPALRLSGKTLRHLKALTPKGKRAKIFLSLSDDYPVALAQVIITAL